MSFESLISKVDSIQREHSALSVIHDILEEQQLLGYYSREYLSYSSNDSIYLVFLSKKRVPYNEVYYDLDGTKIGESKLSRELNEFEIDLLNRQKMLLSKLKEISDGYYFDDYYIKIFLNYGSVLKLFVFSTPKASDIFSLRDSYYLSLSKENIIHQRVYNKNGKDFQIIRPSGDTTAIFGINSVSGDYYFSNIHLLLFKYYSPDWWLNELVLYSHKNKRKFIYYKNEDRVEIVKHSFEE